MRKLTIILILLISALCQGQKYDTLYTRGQSNYILVPVEAGQEVVKSQENNIMANIYIDIIITLLAGALGIYLSSIKRGINKMHGKVDALTARVDSLDSTVKAQTVVVMDISLCNNVMSRIDFKIQQSLEYLDRDDTQIKGFIVKMGHSAKEAIQWGIHTKLKVTSNEVQAKFELLNMEIRDLLTHMPEEFSYNVRTSLKSISQHHIERTVAIATDNLFNSKLDRFITLTEQTVNEILATIVRTRIENRKL